ncbi:NAD(P)H-binding protein [Mycobacterium intermedium]|nr:NAD(P)H-binding protein [Mycobacterium intermedium]
MGPPIVRFWCVGPAGTGSSNVASTRLFLTGGTGAIGRYAVPALVRAGHQVTALARGEAKAAALRVQGATPVGVSLFDRHDLAEAFAGHEAGYDVVVNLATALHVFVFECWRHPVRPSKQTPSQRHWSRVVNAAWGTPRCGRNQWRQSGSPAGSVGTAPPRRREPIAPP